jgi:hypothetical protein
MRVFLRPDREESFSFSDVSFLSTIRHLLHSATVLPTPPDKPNGASAELLSWKCGGIGRHALRPSPSGPPGGNCTVNARRIGHRQHHENRHDMLNNDASNIRRTASSPQDEQRLPVCGGHESVIDG